VYTGTLPNGLKPKDKPEDVIRRLGLPIKGSNDAVLRYQDLTFIFDVQTRDLLEIDLFEIDINTNPAPLATALVATTSPTAIADPEFVYQQIAAADPVMAKYLRERENNLLVIQDLRAKGLMEKHPELLKAQQRYDELQQAVKDYAATYLAKHPEVLANEPAAPNAPPATEPDAATLRRQQAESHLKDVEQKHNAGLATALDLERARSELKILEAEQSGDAVKLAQARLDAAKAEAKIISQMQQAGLATTQELQDANAALELRQAELNAALPKRGLPYVNNTTELNDDQKLFVEWTDRQFRSFFDAREFKGWSDQERATLEAKCIDALKGPQDQGYYQAINTLGALKSTKALPSLRAIAFDRADKDCRDRWMAVRSLGLMGDKVSVPQMIHLVYHGNLNTRWWAQISLVRLTGKNFGNDWQAWGKWWNDSGGQPAFDPQVIKWYSEQPEGDKLVELLKAGDEKFLNQHRPTTAPR
jgi:hypothetical protein